MTILGSTVSTTNGSAEVVSNDTFPTVVVSSRDYFSNTSVHDRSTDLNASLVKFTAVRMVVPGSGGMILNFSGQINGTDNYTTMTGVLWLPLESGDFNVSVFGANDSGVLYANRDAVLTADPFLRFHNFSALLTNTVNLTFLDEITEQFINETFTLEVISETSAENFTVTDTQQFNVSLLLPNNYTLRYRSENYPERDYFLPVVEGSFQNIELFALSFNESDTVIVTVVDLDGNAIEGAIVKLLRYYVSCNCFKVVEMAETSFSGEANFNAQFFEGHYKWAVDFLGTNADTS